MRAHLLHSRHCGHLRRVLRKQCCDKQTTGKQHGSWQSSLRAEDRLWGRADLAGFGLTDGSDLTWNVVLMGQLKVARRVGLLLGYRWLDIDYENTDDRFALDVRQEGPILAVTYSFY